MRYTLSINQDKCKEWGLNLSQGALFDLLNQASSWAKPRMVDGDVYYWVSRNKVLDEIPVAYSKADTVYRSLKLLEKKGLIHHIKEGKKDLVKLSKKGMDWNVKGTIQGDEKLGNKSELGKKSEINPNKVGNKSELNSEINPTDNTTNTHKNTINNKNGDCGDVANDDFELSATSDKSERENLVMSLFEKWKEFSGQNIQPSPKRLSHINARLNDDFTVEQIITAMEFVATDKWHIDNGQNKIEIAVRSVEQIEKKLIAANKPKPKSKLSVNQDWDKASKPRKIQSTVTFEEMFGVQQ